VGFEGGDEITSYYDPMIAKVIVWDETRLRAIQKMRQTLRETVIFGVRTNIPLLQEILSQDEFLNGTMTTRFFETHFSRGLSAPEYSASEQKLIQTLSSQLSEGGAVASAREADPWSFSWTGRT
jgi:3-methylcrotonyl-CoA carboxylase alpha subunit